MNGHPERLSETEAVHLVYDQDIAHAARLLDGGLSVLVQVTQDVMPYLTEAIASRCERPVEVVSASNMDEDQAGTLAGIHRDQAVIIPDLGVLAADRFGTPSPEARRAAALLGKAVPRAVLAFLDPSLQLPHILEGRFQVHLVADPPPPLLTAGQEPVPLGRLLVTRPEAAMFTDFADERVYPHVAGLSVVQIRRLLATLAETRPAAGAALTLGQLSQEASCFRVSGSATSSRPPVVLAASGLTLGAVPGYTSLKQEISQTLVILNKAPGSLIPPGLLLHGPAGTGKTTLARAMAGELKAIEVMLPGHTAATSGRPSAQLIQEVFAQARRLTSSVLILPDLDALDEAGALAVLNEVRIGLDSPGPRAPLLVIGTTTRLDHVDPRLTLMSGLRPLEVPLPDQPTRRAQAARYATLYQMPIGPELQEAVATATEGLSGTQLRAVFQRVRGRQLAGQAISVEEELGAQVATLQLQLAGPSATDRRRASVTLAVPRRAGYDPAEPESSTPKRKLAPAEYEIDKVAAEAERITSSNVGELR